MLLQRKSPKKAAFYPMHDGWRGLVWINDAVAAIGLATHNEPLRQPRDCALEFFGLSGSHSFVRPCATRAESFRTESRSLSAPSHITRSRKIAIRPYLGKHFRAKRAHQRKSPLVGALTKVGPNSNLAGKREVAGH